MAPRRTTSTPAVSLTERSYSRHPMCARSACQEPLRYNAVAEMGDPVILPRANHTISRGQIDPDALKVLYRLHQHEYTAYLVGGSVRDLLLGRHPKDFDI